MAGKGGGGAGGGGGKGGARGPADGSGVEEGERLEVRDEASDMGGGRRGAPSGEGVKQFLELVDLAHGVFADGAVAGAELEAETLEVLEGVDQRP